MQIKMFNELAKAGEIQKVTVVSRLDGYSVVIRTSTGDEPLRTQKGEPRVFFQWDTLKAKLDEAGIKDFGVIGKA
jgi:hypothetical protein